MRMAICTNFVSPYRRPVFRALAQREGFDVRVFTSVAMERDRGWATEGLGSEPFEVVRSMSLSSTRSAATRGSGAFRQKLERHIPVGLPMDLMKFSPDVILSGEVGPRTAIATVVGRALGVPVVPWTYHAKHQQTMIEGSSRWRGSVLRAAPAVVGMGRQAREILRGFVHDDLIFDAPNAADVNGITRRLLSAEHGRRVASIRMRHAGKRLAVVVGRLVEMKGIDELMNAWAVVDERTRDRWKLVFVGDGPLRGHIEKQGFDNVEVIGNVAPEEVTDWMAAADLHVFASLGDPWGLVVNEAMHCGTPTLCSTRAGCCDDLIIDQVTGITFDPAAGQLPFAGALMSAMARDDLARLGRTGREHAAWFTPERMAMGMAQAARAAMSCRARSVFDGGEKEMIA